VNQDGFLGLPAKQIVPSGMGFDCSALRSIWRVPPSVANLA